MKNFIEKLSRETGKLEKYELIELTEEVKIKKEIFEITHKYYKRLSDDELFEPFEDPDYNLNIDYNTYRNKHNLLYSEDIKEIRNMYKLNIRDFSSILGISYTNLSSIENGSLQPKYIDNLMRLAKDPYAFRNEKSIYNVIKYYRV